MYAVKSVNLLNQNVEHYTPCPYGHTQACDTMRSEIAEMDAVNWELDKDYTIEIVEVDDDFDFDNQPDWN